MKRAVSALVFLAAIVALQGTEPAASAGEQPFPHAAHADAFDSCTGCHAGVAQDNASAAYTVTEATCSSCHDGDMGMKNWTPPAPHRNLKFSHALHVASAGLECADCHQQEGSDNAMAVVMPAPEKCLGCHGEAGAHLSAGNDCRLCHARLSEAPQVETNRIAAYPRPADHEAEGFALEHGRAANKNVERCVTCHARESCERCHREPLDVVQALEPDSRVAALAAQWTGTVPAHGGGFTVNHGAAASADTPRCRTCHAQRDCEQCHDASSTPGFHGKDFLLRHGAEAYARDTDCASCHSTEVFCRDCHRNAGLSADSPVNSSYHDAEPFWLLSHGQAARQGMESCASCHQQNDCLQCHSAQSGWRVNPHGPDFDPTRVSDRNLEMCTRCHPTDPRP